MKKNITNVFAMIMTAVMMLQSPIMACAEEMDDEIKTTIDVDDMTNNDDNDDNNDVVSEELSEEMDESKATQINDTENIIELHEGNVVVPVVGGHDEFGNSRGVSPENRTYEGFVENEDGSWSVTYSDGTGYTVSKETVHESNWWKEKYGKNDTSDDEKIIPFAFNALETNIDDHAINIAGQMPIGTKLETSVVDNNQVESKIKTINDKFIPIASYDIKLMNGNVAYQPVDFNNIVTITLSGFDANEQYIVYRITDDGTITQMDAVNNNGNIVFDTDHFTIYTVGKLQNTNNESRKLNIKYLYVNARDINKYLTNYRDGDHDTLNKLVAAADVFPTDVIKKAGLKTIIDSADVTFGETTDEYTYTYATFDGWDNYCNVGYVNNENRLISTMLFNAVPPIFDEDTDTIYMISPVELSSYTEMDITPQHLIFEHDGESHTFESINYVGTEYSSRVFAGEYILDTTDLSRTLYDDENDSYLYSTDTDWEINEFTNEIKSQPNKPFESFIMTNGFPKFTDIGLYQVFDAEGYYIGSIEIVDKIDTPVDEPSNEPTNNDSVKDETDNKTIDDKSNTSTDNKETNSATESNVTNNVATASVKPDAIENNTDAATLIAPNTANVLPETNEPGANTLIASNPQTGDSALPIILCFVAMGAGVGCIIWYKKNKHN